MKKTNPFPLATTMIMVSGLIFSNGTSVAQNHEAPGLIKSEFIYDSAPFPKCHASTIEEIPGGLIAAWFGGTDEKDPDVGIWYSRKFNGKWSPPVLAADGIQYTGIDGIQHRHPTWNPVLFKPKTGPLMLFYKCGPTPDAWWGMLMTSVDNGSNWSLPRRLPEGIDGPVKNKPIQLEDGRILCGSSTEHDGWRLHMELTGDFGITWQRIGPLNPGKAQAIQPSLLTYRDGRMQLLARNKNGNGDLWQAWSTDNGASWSKLKSTGLPNPNSGTDAVTLKDGRQLLVYNHTHRRGPSPRGREMLNVAVSEDGKIWKSAMVLENTPHSEFSYPAVIQTQDDKVHITYTWNRTHIKHAVIDPEKLVLKKITDRRIVQ